MGSDRLEDQYQLIEELGRGEPFHLKKSLLQGTKIKSFKNPKFLTPMQPNGSDIKVRILKTFKIFSYNGRVGLTYN